MFSYLSSMKLFILIKYEKFHIICCKNKFYVHLYIRLKLMEDGKIVTYISLAVISASIILLTKHYVKTKKEEVENYRRGTYRNHGNYRNYSDYGYLGYPWYARNSATSWPPYLYGGYNYNTYYNNSFEDKCVLSNAVDDCYPDRPYKIGKDTTGSGVKNSWQCCRK